MSAPRFELVRTSAEQPWHVRIVAGNGEPLFTSENYAAEIDALNAVAVVGELFDVEIRSLRRGPRGDLGGYTDAGDGPFIVVDVRDVDERATVSS